MTEKTTILAENAKAQMRKGLLEFCVLLIISKEKRYASELLEILKEADLIVVEGTLYPLLNRLKRSGLLSYDWEESRTGPPRKYYSLTAIGRELVSELLPAWRGFSRSIGRIVKRYA